jgi:hypothetical protein
MIEASRFIWMSGLALLLGGALYSSAWILFAILGRDPAGPWWLPLNLLVVAGSIGIALGLPGFHAYQGEKTGLVGLLGMIMMFVGILLAGVARQAVEAYTLPHLGRVPPDAQFLVTVAGPLLFFGIVITGAMTWRAGVYPPWTGAALIIAAVAGLIATYVAMPPWLRLGMPVLYSATLAYLGFFLMVTSRAQGH